MRRLGLPLGIAGFLALLAWQIGATARHIREPFRPDRLVEATLRVDDVVTRQVAIRQEMPPHRVRHRPMRFIVSHAYGPGVSFRLAQDAQRIATPAIGSELGVTLNRDPEEARRMHERYPNTHAEIEIVGVREKGVVIVDPMAIHERRMARRAFWQRLSLGAWLASAAALAVFAFRLRRWWRSL